MLILSASPNMRILSIRLLPMTGRMPAGCARSHATATAASPTPCRMAILEIAVRRSPSPARSDPPPNGDHAMGAYPPFLKEGQVAVCQGSRFGEADLDLVGRKRCRHRGLQKRPVPRPEIRDPDCANLPRDNGVVQRTPGLFGIHERVGTVDEKEVYAVRSHFGKRRVYGHGDVFSRRVVVLDPCRSVPPGGCDDAALGDDFPAFRAVQGFP